MKINLAKVVPALVWIGIGLFWLVAQTGGGSGSDEADDWSGYVSTDTGEVDRYLDKVGVELAQPGLYVDPDVIASGGLTEAQADRIDEAAGRTPGPVRIAVLPAAKLSPEDYEGAPLAYDPDEMTAQLYDRVGVDGTYALLVDAPSQSAGRSFTAYQWAEERPFYDVERAVDDAVDCCAPAYDGILTRFVAEAGDEKTNWLAVAAWVVGGVALLVALLLGWRWWSRRRRVRADDAEVADTLRGPLNEEVIELSGRVSALPADSAVEGVGVRTRRVLDWIEEARHRLDAMDSPDDAEAITTRLADARYQLAVIDALEHGRPVPERTAPCFFDPRHGISVDTRSFTPEHGEERLVPVCAACLTRLDAHEQPEIRRIPSKRGLVLYWEADRASRPYVNGYWQQHRFADRRMELIRRTPARAFSLGSTPAHHAPSRPSRGITFVWESSGSGRSSSSGGSRRSFGGGSSRRSSRRSGGSRGF